MRSGAVIIGILMSLFLAEMAVAHSPLLSTTPADGAVISEAPQAIVMKFGKKARLIKVVLVKNGSEKMLLDIPSKSLMTEFELNAEISEPAVYGVEWRALGEDGHLLKGSFGFTKN